MRRVWGVVGMCVLACVANAARAGPWTQIPGETFTSTSIRYFSTELTQKESAAFRQPTINGYLEHGWRETVTVGAEAEFTAGIASQGSVKPGGLARVFVRKRIWEGKEGEVMSLQGSIGTLADVGEAPHLQPRASFLYGEGYDDGWYDIAVSARFRGKRLDELHSEATYGYRPADGWVTFFQITTIQRLDPKIGEDITSTRAGLFVGYDIAPSQTLVIGARHDFLTEFAPTGTEIAISIWARF